MPVSNCWLAHAFPIIVTLIKKNNTSLYYMSCFVVEIFFSSLYHKPHAMVLSLSHFKLLAGEFWTS